LEIQLGPYNTLPAIEQGVLYASGYDKKLIAFNANTGQKLWDFTGGDYFRNSGPTYYEGKVYAPNDDGYFYCINASIGNMNWRKNISPGGNPLL
jgi:outer membrane protein assembly factor BamB